MTLLQRTLPRAAAYWTAAAVAAIALWTSAAPSTTYPLYEARWHVTAAVTNTVFAVYPLALVVVLLLFGDLADHIGRRAAILWGLLAMAIGTLLFAVAPGIGVVFAGRALMGIGVGLALSPASAAVLEFSRPGRERAASSITTAGTALGLSLATVVGGALIQYAPFPLHLDFWVLLLAIGVVGAGVWFLPRHTRAETAGRWRPRGVSVAPGIRLLYTVAALAAGIAFMFGSVFLALGAQIAEEVVNTHNVFVVGAIMAAMSAVIGITAIVTRSIDPRTLIAIGSGTTLVAFALLLTAAYTGSLPVFLLSTLVSGGAYALVFSGGLGLIGRGAPAHHRAGTISAVYLVAYVLQGAVAIVLGLVATDAGLRQALVVGAIAISVFALVALGLTRLVRLEGDADGSDGSGDGATVAAATARHGVTDAARGRASTAAVSSVTPVAPAVAAVAAVLEEQ